jgi:hypothetical protein
MNDDDKVTAMRTGASLGVLALVSLSVTTLMRRERGIVREIEDLGAQPSSHTRWTDANRWDRD